MSRFGRKPDDPTSKAPESAQPPGTPGLGARDLALQFLASEHGVELVGLLKRAKREQAENDALVAQAREIPGSERPQ